jgi:hypothetical protein
MLSAPKQQTKELVWWNMSEGYAVGLRDKGMIAWVETIEEAQGLCDAFRGAALAQPNQETVTIPKDFFNWNGKEPRYITANGIPMEMPKAQRKMLTA